MRSSLRVCVLEREREGEVGGGGVESKTALYITIVLYYIKVFVL